MKELFHGVCLLSPLKNTLVHQTWAQGCALNLEEAVAEARLHLDESD
jgi:hypothetical protein